MTALKKSCIFGPLSVPFIRVNTLGLWQWNWNLFTHDTGYLDESKRPGKSRSSARTAIYVPENVLMWLLFHSLVSSTPSWPLQIPFCFFLLNYSSLCCLLGMNITLKWKIGLCPIQLQPADTVSMGENDAVIFSSGKMWLQIHAENVAIFIKMKNMLQ